MQLCSKAAEKYESENWVRKLPHQGIVGLLATGDNDALNIKTDQGRDEAILRSDTAERVALRPKDSDIALRFHRERLMSLQRGKFGRW